MRVINFLEELRTYEQQAKRSKMKLPKPKRVIEFPQDLTAYRMELYDRLPSPTDLTRGTK